MTNETDLVNSNPSTTIEESDFTIQRHSALYTGSEPLDGITPNSDGYVPGEYWESENLFLFQPTGSTKIFEVSDEDIRRVNVAGVGSPNN